MNSLCVNGKWMNDWIKNKLLLHSGPAALMDRFDWLIDWLLLYEQLIQCYGSNKSITLPEIDGYLMPSNVWKNCGLRGGEELTLSPWENDRKATEQKFLSLAPCHLLCQCPQALSISLSRSFTQFSLPTFSTAAQQAPCLCFFQSCKSKSCQTFDFGAVPVRKQTSYWCFLYHKLLYRPAWFLVTPCNSSTCLKPHHKQANAVYCFWHSVNCIHLCTRLTSSCGPMPLSMCSCDSHWCLLTGHQPWEAVEQMAEEIGCRKVTSNVKVAWWLHGDH